MNTLMTDDPQWGYLLNAIARIETKLDDLAKSDAQKSAVILSIKEDLHRVELDLEGKIKEQRLAMEVRISPMEDIAEKVRAGKIVAAAVFGGLLALSGLLGAWGVIKEWLLK